MPGFDSSGEVDPQALASILVYERKSKTKIIEMVGLFSGAIPTLNIYNPSMTYEKLHSKGEPQQFKILKTSCYLI